MWCCCCRPETADDYEYEPLEPVSKVKPSRDKFSKMSLKQLKYELERQQVLGQIRNLLPKKPEFKIDYLLDKKPTGCYDPMSGTGVNAPRLPVPFNSLRDA